MSLTLPGRNNTIRFIRFPVRIFIPNLPGKKYNKFKNILAVIYMNMYDIVSKLDFKFVRSMQPDISIMFRSLLWFK
jgi:hypothetical protein